MEPRVVVFPETSLPLTTGIDIVSYYHLDGFALDVGSKYVVTIDGLDSEVLEAANLYDQSEDEGVLPYVGNVSIILPDFSDTGENLVMLTAVDGSYSLLRIKSEDGVYPENVSVSVARVGYTSEHYKYLLMQRLRKYFSMSNEKDRAYTVSFFGKLFDESVTVTEESYNKFVERMDYEMEYCAAHNYYACDDLPTNVINEHGLLLTEAFAAIDIGLEISPPSSSRYSGIATFTKPNGEVMKYTVTNGTNYFYINAKTGTEMKYARQSSPYYRMSDKPIFELDEWNPKHAGPSTYWNYDSEASVVTISGTGIAAFAPTEEQIGGGTFNTIAFGANVTEIIGKCIPLANVTKIVLLQAADSELHTSTASFNYTTGSSYAFDVYTDNEMFKNSTYFPTTWTISWHTLDEWEG